MLKVGLKQQESSYSSIGKNSDSSPVDGEDSGEKEVQSAYKGMALDTMDTLEETLPVRRGISRFYNGKSKSFTILADAASSNIRDLMKPAMTQPYNRKRKNLLALCPTSRTVRTRTHEDYINVTNWSSPSLLPDETPPLHPSTTKM
ncbi:hypothetical protein NE237_031686 [Protea cynaroides]|uniref:Uncharacterized protein n=1 Tax=Protea cynaroides TaxID=273540 RepID=A0A9Q0R2P3_9MAGN|nr:hypothetical protein NE237_031686 [Protea cynaroides]